MVAFLVPFWCLRIVEYASVLELFVPRTPRPGGGSLLPPFSPFMRS